MNIEIFTFFLYFFLLLALGLLSSHKQKTDTDFILGNRSLNFWLTALSAHASDMSSWLFLAYPALIFTGGFFNAWTGIGLILFMFFNWQWIAPKIRKITEKTNSLTLSTYFEKRFQDTSGKIRLASACSCLLFYTIYISSGLIALGFLVESLFNLSYYLGIFLGLFIVMIYVVSGGYKTVAWIDLFQGFFLLGVILFIPVYLLFHLGGVSAVYQKVQAHSFPSSFLPDFSFFSGYQTLALLAGWGLGYFGQPHILTKFMGIQHTQDMYKSKILGISWQILALGGATLIGWIGISIFPEGLDNPELVILRLVKQTLSPFFAGLVLCAILAATTNVMAAQILVVASSLSEDFYRKLFHPKASSKELLWVSKISVIFISLLAFGIAYFKLSSINQLVLYAWSGLGASFGPLTLFSLYSHKINKEGAFWGLVVGAVLGATWPYLNQEFSLSIPALFPAFLLSSFTIFLVSYMTKNKTPYITQGGYNL